MILSDPDKPEQFDEFGDDWPEHIPEPDATEKEPQLLLIEYFRGLYKEAYEKDFERLVRKFSQVEPESSINNPGTHILRDAVTFEGLSLDQIIVTPNKIVGDESYDEFHDKTNIAFRGIAASLDDGDGAIFPVQLELPSYRIFRVKSADEVGAIISMGDSRFDKPVSPSISFAEKSTQFIVMAIPDSAEYPDVYYVIDEIGMSPVFTEEYEQGGVAQSLDILAQRARGEQIIPDGSFEGGDVLTDDEALKEESRAICEWLRTLMRSYSLAIIESGSWQE